MRISGKTIVLSHGVLLLGLFACFLAPSGGGRAEGGRAEGEVVVSRLVIRDSQNCDRIVLSVDDADQPSIRFLDATGACRLKVRTGVGPWKAEPSSGVKGALRREYGLWRGGVPCIEMSDETGQTRLQLGVREYGVGLWMSDQKGAQRGELSLDWKRGSVLLKMDDEGSNGRVQLMECDANGNPLFQLWDGGERSVRLELKD